MRVYDALISSVNAAAVAAAVAVVGVDFMEWSYSQLNDLSTRTGCMYTRSRRLPVA